MMADAELQKSNKMNAEASSKNVSKRPFRQRKHHGRINLAAAAARERDGVV